MATDKHYNDGLVGHRLASWCLLVNTTAGTPDLHSLLFPLLHLLPEFGEVGKHSKHA